MRKILWIAVLSVFVFSCGKNNGVDGNDSDLNGISAPNDSSADLEGIRYEGTYEGKIKNKEVNLELKEETFEISESGKKASGEWSKVDDGSIIELNPNKGAVNTKFYSWSDNNTWMALTDSLTIPENEEFLMRTAE